MPRPGDTLHVPMKEAEFLSGLMKVKPTVEMPRPGTNSTLPNGRKRRKPKTKKV